ncbi:MAG: hypothetical protein LBP87_02525, partial [Planctomycetaceae bacterium]|nr:hypothetical protein [Planctomycetaceae bacterium]
TNKKIPTFLNSRERLPCVLSNGLKPIAILGMPRMGHNSACETIHYSLLTINYHILPFQGVDWGTLIPPRCGGLACVALSGRRKHIILRYLNNYKIDRHFGLTLNGKVANMSR